MAVYKLFPEKDATIYSEYPVKNTGLDEILEVSTFYNTTNPEVSRALIKFSQEELENVIQQKVGDDPYNVYLRLFLADASGINAENTLEVYALSGSWNMGTGRYSNRPETDNGVSWKYRSSSGSKPFPPSQELAGVDRELPAELPFFLGRFDTYVTASYSGSNVGGGTWYEGSDLGLDLTATQSLSYYSDKDINVDVTNIVKNWYHFSNTELPLYLPFSLGGDEKAFPNDGFIIKQNDDNEFIADKNYVTNLKYFSTDTHTIYPPQLEFRWNDFIFNTGSSTATIIDTPKIVASIANNSNTYRLGSVAKMRINVRPQYPTRVFQTSSLYTTNYYFPEVSYYAIKDLDTNEFVIDFDDTYTRISADDQSSYFILYMNGLEPERYYQILLKTNINGSTIILDDNYYFKVING